MIFTLYGDYIRHYGNEIWIGSLIRLLEEFGHNEQSVRAAISRMNRQGWVQSRREGNKSFYSLTPRGKRRIDEAAVRIFKLKTPKWDGKWRILIYTIPEEKRKIRDELRRELVWSGFGTISNSCWISPNDLEKQMYDLIDKYDVREYVDFFVSEHVGPHDDHTLIEKCWNLDEINERYEAFIRDYSQRYIISRNKIEKGEMTAGECFVERAKLVHEYRKFLFVDPGIPAELLPQKWLGDSAASLFSDYYRELAEPANNFFEEIFQMGAVPIVKNKEYDFLTHPYMVED